MHKLYEHYVADEQIDITGREEMIKATGRITSYNVCYTKLLRQKYVTL